MLSTPSNRQGSRLYWPACMTFNEPSQRVEAVSVMPKKTRKAAAVCACALLPSTNRIVSIRPMLIRRIVNSFSRPRWSVPRVLNPQRRRPNQLAIVLLAPDIIITGLALVGLVVTPGEFHLLRVGRTRVYKLAVANDGDLGEFGGAAEFDLQRGRIRGGEFIAHHVHSALNVSKDVIGGGVNMALLQSIQNRFAGHILNIEIRVAEVGRDVIGACLEPQSVTFVQGQIDEAFRPPSPDGVQLPGRAGRIGHFVILAIALINLHRRLGMGIVVPPIRAHPGGAGVRCRDAIELLQVRVEHLRVNGVRGLVGLGGTHEGRTPEAWKGANSPLHEDYVPMAFRISHASLIRKHRDELARRIENIGELLRDPPEIFPPSTIVMIATPDP